MQSHTLICTPILHFMQNKLDVLSRLKNWFEKSCLGDRQAPELVWNITDWKFETVMNMNPGFQINMQGCIRDHFCKANCKQSKLEVERPGYEATRLPLPISLYIGYITTILEDARVYSEHAQKKELDVADVKLAIQNRMDHSFTAPPPRDVRVSL